jgi:hypothetical protein
MTQTSRALLEAFQAQERRFVERRFPLRFETENPAVRELYKQAKQLSWNPATDVPWERFDATRYASEAREAARLVWSRRAWGVYPGLGENTALLVRLCLEGGSMGMDAKLFLAVRPTEEAKHLEACFTLAERLGGYVPDPGTGSIARESNHPFAQMALDPDVSVEAYVAALGCLDDQLDANLYASHLHHATNDIVRGLLRLIATDKQRHAAFAWAFLAHQVPTLTPAGRGDIVDAVREMLERVILRGYRNSWLLSGDRAEIVDAEAITASAGLGASTTEQERIVLRATTAQVRERLRAWGLEVAPVEHPELGRL